MRKLIILVCISMLIAIFVSPVYAEEAILGLELDGLPNPMHDVSTFDEMSKAVLNAKIGQAPQGATGIEYLYIDSDPLVAQITFDYMGDLYCYRAAYSENADSLAKIDGLYFDFVDVEEINSLNVADFPCTFSHMIEDGLALVTWYDPDCQTQYSLSSETAGAPAMNILKTYMLIAPTACDDPFWEPSEG